MPFVHIRSLPFETPIDISTVVEKVSRDLAAATGIGLEHITATWMFFAPGRYAAAGKCVSHQPMDSHPVLVDLLVPDFNSPETVESMLKTVAFSICEHTDVPVQNIFINYQQARSGMVFDAGQVKRW